MEMMLATITTTTQPARPELRPPPLPDALRLYLEQRRRALITELREIDLLLGESPTIPKRERPR
jgi:hypothetical protein